MASRRILSPLSFGVCLTVLLGIGVLATPALALQNPKVSVMVTDKDGNPVPNVPVTLMAASADWKPASGASPMTVPTSKKGTAVFAFAKPGDYLVDAKIDGQQIRAVSVKMRDQQRRQVIVNGKAIEDQKGTLDPRNPSLMLSVPNEANTVDIVLTMGPPVQAQAASADQGTSGPGKIDIRLKELNEAKQAIEGNDYTAALVKLDDVLSKRADMKSEDVAAALYLRSFAQLKLNHHAEAEAAAAEALSLNPQLIPAMDMLWNAQIALKEFPKASETLAKELDAVKDPGQRVPLLYNLALALREQNKDNDALAPLEEAHRLAPDDANIVVQLADLYTSLGRAQDAEKMVGANLPPDQASVLHFNMAAVLLKKKQWPAAEDHLRKALELNPQLADAHRYLGVAFLSEGKPQDAITEYEAFLKDAPNSPDAPAVKEDIVNIRKAMEAQKAQQPQHKQHPKK